MLIGELSMPGKRTTSLDVARVAGVSRSTVSLVLNQVPNIHIPEETRQRIFEAARTLDYHPDALGRRLVTGKTSTVGLVLQQSANQVVSDAFLLQVMLGIEQILSPSGFHVLLKQIDPQDERGYSYLANENLVDGIILSGPRQDDHEIAHLIEKGFPCILMGQMPGNPLPYVDVNAVEGAASAVRHLISLGHQRIGLITNASLKYTSAQQRKQGYLRALSEANIPLDEGLIREGAYTAESGFEAMHHILKQPHPPTAVFVASDVVAIGAIQAIRQAGRRIPEDIAIAGFDDIPMAAYLNPPLTTIRLPAYRIGWAAGEQLVKWMTGVSIDQQGILLDIELIIRESTIGQNPSFKDA